MKKIFCIVFTNDKILSSPIIFHVECDTPKHAEKLAKAYLIEKTDYHIFMDKFNVCTERVKCLNV